MSSAWLADHHPALELVVRIAVLGHEFELFDHSKSPAAELLATTDNVARYGGLQSAVEGDILVQLRAQHHRQALLVSDLLQGLAKQLGT